MTDLDEIKKDKTIKELLSFSMINIDKPKGFTSFEVVNYIRKLLDVKRVGHTGTLDSGVTGVLPVCLGKACKLSNYFMKKDKTYVGTMRLHSGISLEKLREETKKFIGKIIQKPPVKSRVKRVEREREVYSFEILEKNEKSARFFVKCEAGTYIRKLIHELGLNIGGAHMTELRRIQAGIFSCEDENFTTIEALEKAFIDYKNGGGNDLRELLIPAEEAVKKIMPAVQLKVSEKELKQILTGKPIFKNQLAEIPKEKIFAVFSGERFIEVARKAEEEDIIARPEFVLN